MDNIAEGFDAGGNPEFMRFLAYSRRSCSELQSQLYRVKDQGHCDEQQFLLLYDSTASLRAQIGGFIRYLGTKRDFWTEKPPAARQPDNEESGMRNQESKARNQQSKVRNQESEARNQESKVRNQESEARNQQSKVRNQE